MEEKGKTVTIESDEEDKGSPIYVEEVNPEEDHIQPVRQPNYVPPSKGKAKVPTNLHEVDTVLVTLALLKLVSVESSVVSHVVTMKFEDWDLTEVIKFPHLAKNALMEPKVQGTVTMLQPQEWL